MSARVWVEIECDRCRAVGPVVRTAAWISRAILSRSDGWHRNNGVDLCGACWADGVRGPSTYRPKAA